MRVLVPLPFDLTNLAHGRNLRVVNLLRAMHAQCDLTCMTASQKQAESARSAMPGVRVIPADRGGVVLDVVERDPGLRVRIAGSFWDRRAISFIGYDQRLIVETARRAKRSDVVLGFDMPSVVYLLATGARAAARVCDLIDDPSLLRRSFPLRDRWSPAGVKSAVSMRIIRRRVLGTFDSLTAVAPRDAESLSRVAGRQVLVVPNGVQAPADTPACGTREPLVVFTGGMDFPANETAACYLARQIWPRILRHLKRAGGKTAPTLAIVGANPTHRVRPLADLPHVLVTGRVDDVFAWLKRARVAVAPMVSGCGVKNKVLEACAAGCPVVATSLGAAGLPAGEASGIVVADAPEDIAAQVARLLAEPAAAHAVGAAGRRMVQERFSWHRSATIMMDVLAAVSRNAELPGDAGPGPRRPDHDAITLAGLEPRQDQEVLIHAAP